MRQRRLTRFLFDSAYQVVTWVWIAVSISAFFYYASKDSSHGMRWSAASLVLSVIVMIALIASQHFVKTDGKESRERPELYTHGAMMGPLVAGEPETVLVGLKNRGKATARNICLGGRNHVILNADFAGPLVYKHVPVQLRPDLGPGPEEQSAISKSPQPLSQEQIDQLKKGQTLFFHFAEGEYNDGDGNTYPIDYCYMFNPTSPTVMRVCPEKYWPKSRTDRRGIPTIDVLANMAAKSQPPPTPKPHGGPYNHIQWMDYTEDYFYDAIWRWDYIPAMGDTPRNIRGFCPECRNRLRDTGGRAVDKNGIAYAPFMCSNHPLKTYYIASDSDSYDGIKNMIQDKLHSGSWREVVKRQLESPESGVF